MPKQYVAIKEKLLAGGMALPEAKSHAARIYNSKPANKEHPVTGKSEGGGKQVGVRVKRKG